MKSTGKAVIIIPWYGKLPPYFGVYLSSLEKQPFDVLWFSDIEVGSHPDNFRFVYMTFDNLVRRMTEKLGTTIVIDAKIRLSDFKPMYGKIFDDYIEGYDYWGWGDCDLVYGRKFTDFIQRTLYSGEYDVVSLRKDYLTGPVCFLRNTPTLRELFRKASNWRENCALPGAVRLLFDECSGEFHDKLMSGEMTIKDCSKIHDSMTAVVWRTEGIKVYRNDDITEKPLKHGGVVMMKDGILTLNSDEIMVFHYILVKVHRWFFCQDVPYGNVGLYRITRSGFYFGNFAWQTRFLRVPFRVLNSGLRLLRRRSLWYVLKRIGRIPLELAK